MDFSKPPTFFATPAEFREWLAVNHSTANELWVGFHKKDSGKPSITWPESVDEALCVGWIDGVRKRIDDVSYMIRFTPRKSRSIWSAVNIARVEELTRAGRMLPAGLEAFRLRSAERSAIYSHEQGGNAALDEAAERKFKARKEAWEFFQKQPASYRKAAVWWVIGAKKPETRAKRLETLMADSEAGNKVRHLTWKPA